MRFAGGVRSVMVFAGGVCACVVSRVIYAAQWLHQVATSCGGVLQQVAIGCNSLQLIATRCGGYRCNSLQLVAGGVATSCNKLRFILGSAQPRFFRRFLPFPGPKLFSTVCRRGPVVAHWVLDPLGTGDQQHRAAGALDWPSGCQWRPTECWIPWAEAHNPAALGARVGPLGARSPARTESSKECLRARWWPTGCWIPWAQQHDLLHATRKALRVPAQTTSLGLSEVVRGGGCVSPCCVHQQCSVRPWCPGHQRR